MPRHKVKTLKTVTYRLPDELIRALDEYAEREVVTVASVVRDAISEKIGVAARKDGSVALGAHGLAFIQIIERLYRTPDGFQYSMPVGLTRCGEVFEFDGDSWKRLPMVETTATDDVSNTVGRRG